MGVEELKQRLDRLNDQHLQQVEALVSWLELRQAEISIPTRPLWQQGSYAARARELRQWVASLPSGHGHGLSDSACDRATIYD